VVCGSDRAVLARSPGGREHPDVAEPGPGALMLGFGGNSLDFELRVDAVRQLRRPGRLTIYRARAAEAGISALPATRHLRSASPGPRALRDGER
jgi:hypothetical protein